MKTPADLPIRVAHEPIDGAALAAVAHCVVARRGWMMGFGTFIILTRDELRDKWHWNWKRAGEEHFLEVMRRDHHGRLPFLCRVDEWPFH